MSDRIKRLTQQRVNSLFLLLLMLFQSMGTLFIFKTQQYQIRKEIKHRIKVGVVEEELVLIEISVTLLEKPSHTFRWIHEKEFCYYGHMYDIVRKEKHGDTIIFYCLSDEKETQLFANLNELVKRDMNQNTERKEQRTKLLHLLSSLFLSHYGCVPFVDTTGEAESTNYFFSLKTWIEPPLTPPPQV